MERKLATRSRLVLFGAALTIATAGGCGASDRNDAAGELVANKPCTPAAPPDPSVHLPAWFPSPNGVVLTGESTGTSGQHIVDGYANLETTRLHAAYTRLLAASGDKLTTDEHERDDAEIGFDHGDRHATIAMSAACRGRLRVRIAEGPRGR